MIWSKIARSPEDTTRLLILEYIFAWCILPAGQNPRIGDAYSQTKMVMERLRWWGQEEYCQLWEEAVLMTKTPPKGKSRQKTGEPERKEKSQEEKNAERSTKLAQEEQYTKFIPLS